MTNYIKLCVAVGVQQKHECETYDECPLGLSNPCYECDCKSDSVIYSDFTAKKQIELIKLIAQNNTGKDYHYLHIDKDEIENKWFFISIDEENDVNSNTVACNDTDFAEALAGLVLRLVEAGELDKEKVGKVLGQ